MLSTGMVFDLRWLMGRKEKGQAKEGMAESRVESPGGKTKVSSR